MKHWLMNIKDLEKWADINEEKELSFLTDKTVKKDDLIVVYKQSPQTYISHLFRVAKNYESYDYGKDESERFKMFIEKVLEFKKPLKLHELENMGVLDGWITRFHYQMYEIPYKVWLRLNDAIIEKNPDIINHEKIVTTKIFEEKKNINEIINKVKILEKNWNLYKEGKLSDKKKICMVPCNEAVTEEAIINPLLITMGWDTTDPCQIIREYSISRNKVDYALIDGKKKKIFIEAKSFRKELDEEGEEQLRNYCMAKKVPIGILTNGKNWNFYYFNIGDHGLGPGTPKCKLDLYTDKIEDINSIFNKLILKESVSSNKALEYITNNF